MFEEAGSGGFVEAEGGAKRNEAKVGQFARLLEAVHRLVYSKDNVGLAGGVSLDEGEKVKVGENSGRELLGKEFDILGRVERSAKVKVREPKKALSETTELNRMLTIGREATWVEGGQEEGRRSPPTVPRTRRSTPVV